jgi:cytochrome P450
MARVDYDPLDRATNADPFPIFRRLQDEEPVHWSDRLKSWVLTRYDDVRAVALDRELSANRLRPFFAVLPSEEQRRLADLQRYLTLWAVFQDPPDHTRLRGLLNRAFTSSAVEARRPAIAAIVARLMARLKVRDRIDFVADFAYPLPAMVIMDMIGVPHDELDAVKVWSDDIALFIGGARVAADKYRRAERGTHAMADYFRGLVRQRRAQPKDDILTALIAAEEEHQRLTEDEIVASAILLLFAGHETTANLIGSGTLHFLLHREQLDLLNAEPALVESAVEECLRYDGPSGALARVVAVEHEVGGVRLAKGDRVYAMMNAANRDPRRFDDPDRFDITRGDNRHLTFGHGIHFCLGAPLARLEAQIAFAALAEELPRFALAVPPAQLEWIDSLMLRGLKSLPLLRR